MKGPVTKHHQLATTGRAEGLCHGGRPMAKGGKVEKTKEKHHEVHLDHSDGSMHHVHIHHHH